MTHVGTATNSERRGGDGDRMSDNVTRMIEIASHVECHAGSRAVTHASVMLPTWFSSANSSYRYEADLRVRILDDQ